MNWIKSHPNYLARLLCLLLIGASLCMYQTRARTWEQKQQENQEQIAEVEAYNADILLQQQQEQEAAVSRYIDGVYTGTGEGFGGPIEVEVTVSGDRITGISITSAEGEDSAYLGIGKEIIDTILAQQSANVDTVTGATFSSGGIRAAVSEAMEKAVNSNG